MQDEERRSLREFPFFTDSHYTSVNTFFQPLNLINCLLQDWIGVM